MSDWRTRFWNFVEVRSEDECWPWKGRCGHDNRAQFSIEGRTQNAARVMLRLHGHALHRWLYACHRCDNPNCVNPNHLFVGTAYDNNHDAKAKGRMYVPREQCKYGHPLSGDNVIVDPRGGRKCRTCQNAMNMRWRARKSGITATPVRSAEFAHRGKQYVALQLPDGGSLVRAVITLRGRQHLRTLDRAKHSLVYSAAIDALDGAKEPT